MQSGATLGAAVYDLDAQIIWSGGVDGPYAMHSMVKPAIAWAIMTDAYEQGIELTKLQRDALFYMVAWSQNADVNTLLGMIGGLSGLSEYYARLGVRELARLQHESRWGSGRASPSDLARLFAALAVSQEVPDAVRAEGFELLRQSVPEHVWGATIPTRRLVGWESLIKTGNFILGGADSQDIDGETDASPESSADRAAQADFNGAEDEVVRMNSAAIWLEAPWLDGRPRYVIAIMQESGLGWSRSRALQDRIGATLANAIADRLLGQFHTPRGHCLKRMLY